MFLIPSGKPIVPLPEPVKPASTDIKTVIVREKLAKQCLKPYGIQDFNAVDLKVFGFSEFDKMKKEDIRDFFKEFDKTHKDATLKNLCATDSDRMASLKESVLTKDELREMLKDAKSFHIDAILTDQFVDQIFQEVKGTKKS